MKKCILLFSIAMFITSCAFTDQQKAEKAVKEYILPSLTNPKSYESVSFSKIKPCTLDFSNTKVGESMFNLLESELSNMEATGSHIYDAQYYKDKSDFENKEKEYGNSSLSKGWMVTHKYRGTNGYGATITEEKVFYLSSTFNCEYSK